MHTIIVMAIGFALLGTCVWVGHVAGGSSAIATAALAFLPLWLCGAGINMAVGVRKAGYSVTEEAPIFLLVFAVPAVLALVVWWKFR